jgi:hypothetical protein
MANESNFHWKLKAAARRTTFEMPNGTVWHFPAPAVEILNQRYLSRRKWAGTHSDEFAGPKYLEPSKTR